MPVCPHHSKASNTLIKDTKLEVVDLALLGVARRFFLSYTDPRRPHWESAVDFAINAFGPNHGPLVAVALLNVIRAMRSARKTMFRFNNPHCTQCAATILDNERSLFLGIQHLRQGNMSGAHIEVLILCEGHDTAPTLSAMEVLASRVSNWYRAAPTVDRCKADEPRV